MQPCSLSHVSAKGRSSLILRSFDSADAVPPPRPASGVECRTDVALRNRSGRVRRPTSACTRPSPLCQAERRGGTAETPTMVGLVGATAVVVLVLSVVTVSLRAGAGGAARGEAHDESGIFGSADHMRGADSIEPRPVNAQREMATGSGAATRRGSGRAVGRDSGPSSGATAVADSEAPRPTSGAPDYGTFASAHCLSDLAD